ncbi:hypothetical protein C8R45DRAFT_1220565 [Mycena sanguinolenta]|nr:hypothetical protein C8R45DRAFT_1220565 [Mycena sanguinolenta]
MDGLIPHFPSLLPPSVLRSTRSLLSLTFFSASTPPYFCSQQQWFKHSLCSSPSLPLSHPPRLRAQSLAASLRALPSTPTVLGSTTSSVVPTTAPAPLIT